jgi:hypothetical protein
LTAGPELENSQVTGRYQPLPIEVTQREPPDANSTSPVTQWGIAGGKKHNGADYILGLSQPTERRSADQLLGHGAFENADRMRPLRLSGARSDDVHTNVSGAELFRKHV